jgi:hypothetical protein
MSAVRTSVIHFGCRLQPEVPLCLVEAEAAKVAGRAAAVARAADKAAAVPTPVCIEEFSTHLQNTLARMHVLRSVGFFLKKQMFFGCSGQWEQELTPAGRQMFGGTHCKAVSPDKPHMHNGNLCTASHEYFVSSTPAAARAAFTMTLDKIQGPRCVSSH